MDPAQVEERRRIWSYLYHADRSYALVLGRPFAIQDDYTCTLPPLNVEEDCPLSQIRNPPPLSTPTLMTYVILRHNLASIIGRMVHHFQQVRMPNHYSDVLALDEDLQRFMHNLPPHYALEPNTALDQSMKFPPVHRFLLITEVLFVRISLHRPYLLRRLSSDRYYRSRKACFESAMKDYNIRRKFRETQPKETRDSLSNAYREFQTAMISGIYLVLDPHGKDSEIMHNILDSFLEEHDGLREMDETTRRELRTIEFLKSKASELADSHPPPAEATSPTTDNSAVSGNFMSKPPLPLMLPETPGSNSSPQMSPSTYGSQVAHVPLIQRLQHSADGGSLGSPAGTSSPSGEEESSAQSLLDNWCNTFAGGPVEGQTGIPALSWGGADFSGWVGSTAPSVGTETSLFNAGDGSDWNYWETLVNQIKGAPGTNT